MPRLSIITVIVDVYVKGPNEYLAPMRIVALVLNL